MTDPIQFIDYAKKLLKYKDTSNEDLTNRTIINRTYFGSLLSTQLKLNAKDVSLPITDKIHQLIIDKLKDKNPDLGNVLFTLHENRLNADLDLNHDSSNEVNDSLGMANYLVSELKKL